MSSHPRLHIPEETGFIPFLVKDVDANLSLEEVHVLLDRIGRLNYLWHNLVDNIPELYSSLPEPKLRHLLNELYCRQIAVHGASRWGDKTPNYVNYIPLLSAIFPTAQFLHLIRDGRDTTLSAIAKWPERGWYMDSYYLLTNWARNVRAGRRDGQALGPDRYVEVRYERMVQEPQQTLHEVLAFLDEEPHPAMFDHTRLARKLGPGPQEHVEVQQPVSTASVQRWRTEMVPFEKKLANRLAGELLQELGYELADVDPLSASETARALLLSGKFHLADAARTLLYATGILSLNRDLRR